jgi:spore maturation protein CgeB
MKILYVGLLYNYGKKEEGFSYEHFNIEAGLKDCAQKGMFGVDCLYPDATDNFRDVAIGRINDENFDAIFHVAFNESLDLPESVAGLALKKDIPVIQFDCDSSWRFHNWIAPRRDRVSHFITTHSATVPWYQAHGMKVIKSQWAGSPLYQPNRDLYKYDISFIGQKHGRMPDGRFLRSEIINAFIAAGLPIDLFGHYWDGYERWHGYVIDYQEIINIFNQSRISLNLSNPWHHGTMPQIKGRHFEIPQTGGFQLCTPADDLDSYFVEDKEIVIARSVQELVEKACYYLEHSNEREVIAMAGLKRMLAEHQWHHRFEHIFKEVGLYY